MKYCARPYNYLYLDNPDGDIWLCPWMKSSSGKIGNCITDTIDNCYNSAHAKYLRSTLEDGTFRECRFEGCPHLQNDDLPDLSPEEYERRKCSYTRPVEINMAYDLLCNQSCETCRREVFRPSQDYDRKMRTIQERIAPYLDTAEHISASGHGDPFASRYMMDLLANMRPTNPKLQILLETNGVFLDENHWERIAHLAAVKLDIVVTINSFDPHTYAQISRGGNYEKVLSNLEFMSRLRREGKISVLSNSFVIQDKNFREIPAFIRRSFQDFAFDAVVLKPVYQWGTMDGDVYWYKDVLNPLHPYHKEYLEIIHDPIVRDNRVYNYGGDTVHEATPYPGNSNSGIQQIADIDECIRAKDQHISELEARLKSIDYSVSDHHSVVASVHECCKNDDRNFDAMYKSYAVLQDDLSRVLFMGRMEYSFTHRQVGLYRSIISAENMRWLRRKKILSETLYGMHTNMWNLILDNYPVQRTEIYLLSMGNDEREDEFVRRFLDAVPQLGIHVHGIVFPFSPERTDGIGGIPVISEQMLLRMNPYFIRAVVCAETVTGNAARLIDHYAKTAITPVVQFDITHDQYFETDIFPPKPHEIFVDVGVFDMGSSVDFAMWAKQGYDMIYAFEPDPHNYQVSLNCVHESELLDHTKVCIENKGLGSENKMVPFYENVNNHSDSYFVRDGNATMVEMVTLDTYLVGKSVTFIKIDVEGAELDVLRGAFNTIKLWKPRLAVCVYHNHQDLLDISQWLLNLVPEYKMYIRHYTSYELETVLFCTV